MSLDKKDAKVEVEHKHGIIKSRRLGKSEEYFAQREVELIKEHGRRLENQKKEDDTKRLLEEKERLRELHHMKCPKCGMDLTEISFMNVMVDVCQECLGLWLDQGELETIILQDAGFFSRLCNKIGLKKIASPVKKKSKAGSEQG